MAWELSRLESHRELLVVQEDDHTITRRSQAGRGYNEDVCVGHIRGLLQEAVVGLLA